MANIKTLEEYLNEAAVDTRDPIEEADKRAKETSNKRLLNNLELFGEPK